MITNATLSCHLRWWHDNVDKSWRFWTMSWRSGNSWNKVDSVVSKLTQSWSPWQSCSSYKRRDKVKLGQKRRGKVKLGRKCRDKVDESCDEFELVTKLTKVVTNLNSWQSYIGCDEVEQSRDKVDQSRDKVDDSHDKVDYNHDKVDYNHDKVDYSRDKVDYSRDKVDQTYDKRGKISCKCSFLLIAIDGLWVDKWQS